MSTSYHHGDLKAVLLALARQALEQRSLDGLSMRELAKGALVSHTAAYRHFADKRALLDAVAVQGFEEMHRACHLAVTLAAPTPRERLLACGLAYVRFGLQNPMLLAHMFSVVTQPGASDALRTAGSALFDTLLQLVAQGQQAGGFRAGDARETAHACWAMVHGLATLLSIGQTPPGEALVAARVDSAHRGLQVLFDGLASAPAERAAPATR
jgi:AcrR family transcriptional regulator